MASAQNALDGVKPTNNSTCEEQVFAFDVPLELSADDAAKLIDEATPEGFYTAQMVIWPGAGMRVFCKRSKATNPEELAEKRRLAADAARKAKDLEDEQAHVAVARILAVSPRITVGAARVRLVSLGFRRGTDFVKESMRRAWAKA